MSTMKDQINKKDLLEAIEKIKLRTEKQGDESNKLENFVQIIDFAPLSSPNTQIIYGRNGTGKTHLLKAFYQYCEFNFENNKVLPVYIDFKDLELGPILPSLSLDDLILRFYRRFFYKVVDRLKEFSDKVITVSRLEKLFGGESANRKSKIDESIGSLYSLLNLEEIEEKVKEYIRKVQVGKEGFSKIGGRVSISNILSLSKFDTELGAGFEVAANEVEKEKETIELVYGGLAIIDYEKIRSEIEFIIQQAGAEAIIILIDEWSSLSLSVQPLFAEMMRKTLAVSDRIFLKLVALKYLTRTSAIFDPPQRIGFQSGVDITPLADLDYLLNYDIDTQGVKDYLTLIAYEHTCLELPTLKKFTVKEFEEYLCDEVFENENIYFEVVRSSEGNPRDFLSLLSSTCTTAKLTDDKKISFKQAIYIASTYFTENKAPEIRNNSRADELYDKIFRKTVKNRQKLFLLSRKRAESNPLIQELWHYRFIHLVNSNLTILEDDDFPHEYVVYSMDYGKLLSLKVSEKGDKAVNLMLARLEELAKNQGIFSVLVKPLLINVIKSEKVGGTLKRTLATNIIEQEGGIETADFTNINYLVENCVFDNLF